MGTVVNKTEAAARETFGFSQICLILNSGHYNCTKNEQNFEI